MERISLDQILCCIEPEQNIRLYSIIRKGNKHGERQELYSGDLEDMPSIYLILNLNKAVDRIYTTDGSMIIEILS